MFLKKEMYLLILILIAMSGCGSSSSTTTATKTGYVIDAPVANLTYKCGDKTAKTGIDGRFDCTVLPVSFFIGSIKLGSITSINSDAKVFVQDIVQVDRNDFNNSQVLKLAILLQSLDKDKNSRDTITIRDDVNLSSVKSFTNLSLTELNTLLTTVGVTPVSSEDAEQHLREFSDIDTLVPILTLNGESSVSLFKNESYKELGAVAKDDRDKNLTVVITGTVKTDTVGSYTLKYNVSDKAKNKAKELSRTVLIKDAAPVVASLADVQIDAGGNITPIIFNSTGGDITSCSISPALPNGLILSSDCKITGTPTTSQNNVLYSITATNDTASVTATVNLSITIPFIATDDLLPDQWYIKNTGTAPDTWGKFTNLVKNADLNVTSAWNQGVTGEGVVVTVVDDGVDFTHPDLINQEKKGLRLDAETDSNTTFNFTDTDNHGTGCAGVIAAQGNNGGVVGIAPNAQLTGHRFVFSYLKSYNKMRIDNVSRVSNHSYGPPDNGFIYPVSTEDYDAVKALVTTSHQGKGHIMLTASGNGRDSGAAQAEKYGDYAGLDMSQQVPYVICVSGFGATDQEISYAEAGPAVLVAGSTGETFTHFSNNSVKPLTAPIATTGRTNINYVDNISFRDDGTPEPTGYNMAFDGTSAAAPSVAGVVALMLSANPDLTWRDVRWILAKTARKIQLNGKVIDQATGEPSTESYWSTSGNSTFGQYSHYFGYGAADAGAAVKLAKSGNYNLLPTEKECTLTDDNGVVKITAECPNTIEFVRVKYGIAANTSINDMTFTMQLNNNANKEILLLRPSFCSFGKNQCDQNFDYSVTSGTVGFLGDSIKENDTFNFTVSNENGASESIIPLNITIMGYDK